MVLIPSSHVQAARLGKADALERLRDRLGRRGHGNRAPKLDRCAKLGKPNDWVVLWATRTSALRGSTYSNFNPPFVVDSLMFPLQNWRFPRCQMRFTLENITARGWEYDWPKRIKKHSSDTVDGRIPTPLGRWFIPSLSHDLQFFIVTKGQELLLWIMILIDGWAKKGSWKTCWGFWIPIESEIKATSNKTG